MQAGDKLQAEITIRKVKNGVPTVVVIDGREYIWRCPTTRPPATKGEKKK